VCVCVCVCVCRVCGVYVWCVCVHGENEKSILIRLRTLLQMYVLDQRKWKQVISHVPWFSIF